MFTQLLDPLDNLTLTCLVALVPAVSLLILLAVFRWPAWLATLVGSVITFALAAWVWKMPSGDGWHAYHPARLSHPDRDRMLLPAPGPMMLAAAPSPS